MSDQKNSATRPGADRMNLERKVRRGGKMEDIVERRESERRRRVAGFAFIFSLFFAVLYSYFYVDTNGLGDIFGEPLIDSLLFGPGFSTLFDGGGIIDQVLTILIRTLFFMVVFGILPYITFRYARTRDVNQANAYQLFWGMTAFLAAAILFTHALAWPFIVNIFEQFSFE
tara:strand:- start:230 stop:742 length:513 start_codon:yes stop_codon:yes gene_type:complete